VASFWGDEDEFVICADLKSTSRILEQIYMKSLTVVPELAKFIYEDCGAYSWHSRV
jgi:hypothetical protein